MEVIILDLIPFMNIYFYLNVLFNDPYVFILYLTNEVNSLHQHKFRKIPCICASIVAQNIFVPMVPKVTFGGSFGFGCLNLRWKLRSSVNSAFGRSLPKTGPKKSRKLDEHNFVLSVHLLRHITGFCRR